MDPLTTRVLQILLVPKSNADALWTVAPLIFALVMLSMYFGKYKTEQLGWNTAFGNSISLMWVSMALLKYLFETVGYKNVFATAFRGYLIMIGVVVLLTVLLMTGNFHHALPKRLAFILSSSVPVNMMAYFTIVIVMGTIPLDWNTLLACVFIFLFVGFVIKSYKKIIDPDKRIVYTLKQQQIRKHRRIGALKRSFKSRAYNALPLVIQDLVNKRKERLLVEEEKKQKELLKKRRKKKLKR